METNLVFQSLVISRGNGRGKKCLKMNKTKDMFPLNPNTQQDNLRFTENYMVQHATTGRLLDSAIPQMQRALNVDAAKSNR